MNRKLGVILEISVIVLACISLVAFMGPPNAEQRRVRSPQRTTQTISEAGQPWDRNLVLPKQSDRIANYTMDVKLDTEKNIISGWEILDWKNTTGRPQA